eukprot:14740327-Ditylum_brightwellii.AAC.1
METAGTNNNEAILALEQVISNLSKIADQRNKVLKVLKTDESKSWGDGILEWCNAVRTNHPVQLVINGRYLLFIVNKKNEDDFDPSMFSTSQQFTAKSSSENATTSALDEKKSVYDAFKNSKHSNGIDVSEYKYILYKALDTKLMVE